VGRVEGLGSNERSRAHPGSDEPGWALDFHVGACPCRRTGAHFAGTCASPRSEYLLQGAPSVALNALEVSLIAETLRVDLVDVLGAGWPRRKPARLGFYLDAADRLAISGAP